MRELNEIDRAYELEKVIEIFEWKGAPSYFYLDLEPGTDGVPLLTMTFGAEDNYKADNPLRLTVRFPVNKAPAANQLRDAVHWLLCHEADEQMFFDGDRLFDPHRDAWKTP